MKKLHLALGATVLALGLSQTTLGQQSPLPSASGESVAKTRSSNSGRRHSWRNGKMGTNRRARPVVRPVTGQPAPQKLSQPVATAPRRAVPADPTVFGAEAPTQPSITQRADADRVLRAVANFPTDAVRRSASPQPLPAVQPISEQAAWNGPNQRPSYLSGKMSRSSRLRRAPESPGAVQSEPSADTSWISDATTAARSDEQEFSFASDMPQDRSIASSSSHLPHSASLSRPELHSQQVGFAFVGDLAPIQPILQPIVQPIAWVDDRPTAWVDDQPTPGDYTGDGRLLDGGPDFPLLWGGGERLYARAEYLRWQISGDYLPALVTSSPAGTAQNEAGVLGFGTTTILFGDRKFHGEDRPGGRLTIGYWLSSDDVFGIEATFYQLESSTSRFSAASTGDPILARPFFNVDPNVGPGQDSSILAMTGWSGTLPRFGTAAVDLQGDVSVFARSELRSGAISFRGVGVLGGQNADIRTDWLAGYRYFDFNEILSIEDTIFPSSAPFISGTRLDGLDRFQAKNRFHGGELAVATRFRFGRLSGELISRVALGNMHEEMTIQGTTTTFVPATMSSPDETVVVPGGLLAQSTNSGVFRRDRLAIIPELSLNLNYQVTNNLSVTGGYSVIYVNQIVRAGDQVDATLNSSMFGGATGSGSANPHFSFAETEMLIHGLSGGVELRY